MLFDVLNVQERSRGHNLNRLAAIRCFQTSSPKLASWWSDPMSFADHVKKAYREWQYPTATWYFKKDGISRARYTLCYNSTMARRYLPWAMWASPCILGFLAWMIYFWIWGEKRERDPYDIDQSDAHFYAIWSFFLLIWLTFFMISKRYVIRMYYSESKNQYVGILSSPFNPLGIRRFKCKPGDAIPLNTNQLRNFGANCTINGTKRLVDFQNFKFNTYFNVLFGYDKPDEIIKLMTNKDINVGNIIRDKTIKNPDLHRTRTW